MDSSKEKQEGGGGLNIKEEGIFGQAASSSNLQSPHQTTRAPGTAVVPLVPIWKLDRLEKKRKKWV